MRVNARTPGRQDQLGRRPGPSNAFSVAEVGLARLAGLVGQELGRALLAAHAQRQAADAAAADGELSMVGWAAASCQTWIW